MAFLAKLFGKKKRDDETEEEIENLTEKESDSAEEPAEEPVEEILDDAAPETEEIAEETNDEIASEETEEEPIAEKTAFEETVSTETVSVETVIEETPVEETIPEEVAAEPDSEESAKEQEEEMTSDETVLAEEPMEETTAEDEEGETLSFWEKLKRGLQKTRKALFGSIHDLLKNFVSVDEDLLEELEELLISSDIGVNATETIIDELRDRIKDGRLKEKDDVVDALKEILRDMIGEGEPLRLDTTPSVILVIGVNGAGKTTSIGKISKRLRKSGKSVVVAAADTFRAAAIDQLAVWCDRAKVDMVRQNEGSDPAAVVFDAIGYAKKTKADVLIVDTAGRLHNKTNLMNELAKINRVIDRELPGACRENLLVLDATTGQNAVMQAKEFGKAANITGITLNKLDGSAKGGIVISIKQELGIPVKFIGVGEKIDDMQEFDAEQFIDALFD